MAKAPDMNIHITRSGVTQAPKNTTAEERFKLATACFIMGIFACCIGAVMIAATFTFIKWAF